MEEQKIAHKRFLVEISACDGCELDCAEFDVGSFIFFCDEGDVAEIAEKVVDAAKTNIFGKVELQNWRLSRFFFPEPQRRMNSLCIRLGLRVSLMVSWVIRMRGMGLNDVINPMADIVLKFVLLFNHGVDVWLILINWCNFQFKDLFL